MVPFAVFEKTLRERFGGTLAKGQHDSGESACALECAHASVGDEWSDDPDKWPDITTLNDAPWSSDAIRTEQMLRLMQAYWDWSEWPEARRREVVERIVFLTVQGLVAELPGFSQEVARACREGVTLQASARAAAAAALAKLASREIELAWTSAEAADTMLIRAVDLWVEAAEVWVC